MAKTGSAMGVSGVGAAMTWAGMAIAIAALCLGAGAAMADDAAAAMGWDALDAAFGDPPAAYRMVQYSGHHAPVVPLEKMQEYGIGGVMLFLSSQDYLRNDAAWEVMAENIRRAKALGMQVWVADDNGYPSGMAGGLLVEADPAYEARGLVQVTLEGEGPGAARLDLPAGLERFVHGVLYPRTETGPDLAAGRAASVAADRIEAEGIAGPWTLAGFALDVIDEGTQAQQTAKQFQTSGRYANLLHADAMAAFVEMTHAAYARRLGALEGAIDVFYTNEPNLMTLYFEPGERPGGLAYAPWDAALPERFRAARGYDLMPALAALFGGEGDDAELVRRHFYQTVGEMMAEGFSGRIARWAEANGVRSGGHLLLEEYTAMHVINYGDFLRVLGEQHVPGCDIPMPDAGARWNYWMPKYVSSAAYLRDRTTVSALLDPIIGRREPMLEPSPEDFRRIVGMAYLTGVNQMTTYIRWDRYDATVYRSLNDYAGRLALLLRGATNAADIAMYYPIETFQAAYTPSPEFWSPIAWRYLQNGMQASQDAAARAILESGRDFNYVDADAVLSAEIRDGRLAVGANRYGTLVLPRVELLPLTVGRKLEAFEAAGGTLVWVDALPRLGDAPEEHAAVREAAALWEAVAPEELAELLGPANPEGFGLDFDPSGDGLFTVRYTRAGRNLYYVVNNTGDEMTRTVRGASGSVRVYDPMDGGVREETLPATLTLAPYAGCVLAE